MILVILEASSINIHKHRPALCIARTRSVATRMEYDPVIEQKVLGKVPFFCNRTKVRHSCEKAPAESDQ